MKILKRVLAAMASTLIVVALISIGASAASSTVKVSSGKLSGSYIDNPYYVVANVGQSFDIGTVDVYEMLDAQGMTEGDVDLALVMNDVFYYSSYVYEGFDVDYDTLDDYGYITVTATSRGSYFFVLRGEDDTLTRLFFIFLPDGESVSEYDAVTVAYLLGRAEEYQLSYDDEENYTKGYNAGNSYGYSIGYDAGLFDGKSQGYNDGYSKGYSAGKSTAVNASEAYEQGYTAGFNSVIQTSDGSAVSGMFTGIFGAFYDGYNTIANGISISGISVGAIVSSLIVIFVAVFAVKIALKIFTK